VREFGSAKVRSGSVATETIQSAAHARFAPKAAFTNEDVIRRFVPQADFIAV